MSHHESCCSEHHHHHHHEHCSAEKGHEHHHDKEEEDCDMPEKLLCLADEAWKELLKEKITEEIRATSGEKINKLAKVIVQANKAKWENKIAAKKHCHEYQENLKQVFCSSN